jgi:hypothetical protein
MDLAHFLGVRREKYQTLDTKPETISLTDQQRASLAAAIPFQRAASESDPLPSIIPETREPNPSGTAFLKKKGKWHSSRDAFSGDGTLETDILMDQPLHKNALDAGSL